MLLKQSGENKNYPEICDAWKMGEPIPEWLSDSARVKEIKEDGTVVLSTSTTSSGGVMILGHQGPTDILVTLKSEESWIIHSKTHKLISLTDLQLRLLYDYPSEGNR